MPRMNGFECVARVRAWDKLNGTHTSVICITGSQQPHIQDECTNSGMDGYLSKDCSETELKNALTGWVV